MARIASWKTVGVALACGVVMMTAGTQAQGGRTAQRRTPSDLPTLAFEKFTLPNGLEVILSQNRRLPLVAVNLWYHVGPAKEEPGRTGFAHLFEHLMFQGSKHTPPDSHFSMLEAAGASDVNGTTDFDRTNYFETVPSNQLELALWIESDRMGYLLDNLDQAALSNQQDVVRNERRQSYENRPYGLADEALVQLLYPKGHPYYGNIIGSHEDIQAAKLGDVRDFFTRYYSPNNASLALVGDFDPAQARALVTKYFGTLKRGPAVPPVRVETPPITAERRRVLKDRVQLPRVYMGWLTAPIYQPGDAEADIAAVVLGGGRSSRLYKKLVYERQIAQDVFAGQQSLALGSQFEIVATARPGHTLEELEQAIDAELAELAQTPPTAEEMQRAKNSIETRIIERLETLGGFGGVADTLNEYNHYLKTPDYLQKNIERYRGVSAAAVQGFVKGRLGRDARAVVQVIAGTPDPVPTVPTPPAASASAASAPAGQGANADEPWRREVPKAGPARALQLPVLESAQLPNGLTLILNTRRGLPVVAANLVFRTGGAANPTTRPGLASFTAGMLDEGTTTRTSLQIGDEVALLGASLGANASMDGTTVTIRSLRSNFDATLGLAADIVLRPTFPDAEIERQRQARIGQLTQQRDNPNAITTRVVGATLFGEAHPYGFPDNGTEAATRALTRDDLVNFWKQNYVPNNAALVVAGDISMVELRSLAEKAFGGWARGTPVAPQLSLPAPPNARVVIVDRPGAAQTELSVVTLGVPRSSPDFRALQVMNMALGGSFSGRINMNLREEHGYTYGAYSQFIFRRLSGWFQAGGGVRTDVTAPAAREILKEVQGITVGELPTAELARVKDTLTRSLAAAFETSPDAAASFSNVFLFDLGLDYFAGYAASVNAVTPAQALAVAQKYLPAERLVVVAVGDRSKIEPDLRGLGLPVEIRGTDGGAVN